LVGSRHSEAHDCLCVVNPVEGVNSGDHSGTDDDAEEDIKSVYTWPPPKSVPKVGGASPCTSSPPICGTGPSGDNSGEFDAARPCV
ncbi:hypothetical protein A2U01_0085850, partial [Trifolium medium]|nr:hypothetical protein [Trifolium medium]